MYHLRSFHPRHMTACGAVLRRLGTGAITLQEVAHRLVRHLYTSFTRDKTGEPVCVLVRLWKTTPYGLLTPDLQALADQKLQPQQPSPSLLCLTLLASTGIHPGWNDPTLSSRFRVLPLNGPDALERLPMFQQLFRQLGFTLPHVTASNQNLLLDPSEHSFNVFHVPKALGSPHVPGQEAFVRRYGIRSVLGFCAPLPNDDLFSIILFSKDYISGETAQLVKPLALCAQIALAPHARPTSPAGQRVVTARSETADLEQLLTVHEQTVNAQAERLELIVQSSQIGTWDWHVPSGHITFNERWAAMIGYHLDELEPHVRTWEKLVHPDDLPAVMAAVTAHLRGETPAYSTEYRLRSKSSAWRWVFDSGRVVERDARGTPLRATSVHLDISDRKELEAEQARAQRALQVKQAALDEAQTLAHLGSWEWEIDSGAERWSDEQYRIFGLDPARTQPTYATFLTALHPDDRERVEQAVAKTLTYDTRYNIECRIIRPNGELRYIHLRGIVHRQADGSPVGLSGTVQDITEYKRAESAWRDSETRMRSIFESAIEGIVVINERGQIETANPALLTLLSYEAHEFIGKNISLIMTVPYREHHNEYLTNYLVTGKRAIIGIGRDVTAVRKDGSPMELHLSVSEMHIGTSKKYTGMIRESEERFRQSAESIDAVFWLSTPDKHQVLYVSPAFETIWESPREVLYANPLFWLDHIHPEDHKRVSVAAACQAHLPYGPDLLRFTITDPGIGMPKEAQAKLFQALMQADSSTTRRFGGTGLGLAICQRLVTQMNGQIGAESRPGEGSTFSFTAPFLETALADPPAGISWSRLRGRRILLVDPNKTVCKALQQELSAQGIKCLGAETGQAAVELAHAAAAMQKPFDLALVELHLTDMDGFEMARTLKQHPSTAGMRLVILITVERRGDGATAQALGIDAYLTKPIRQSQLLECFSQLLGVTVPAAPPKAAAAPPLLTRHTLTETQRTAVPCLLLAEDNPVNQKVACKMLEKLGYQVDVAGNGQEAVAAHERAPYPLIFMDCQMPEVDGFEATALIRKMEGKSARTPIIAMTANAMQGDRERCLAAGMDDYVAKPIRPKELQAVLETWLGNRAIKTGTTG